MDTTVPPVAGNKVAPGKSVLFWNLDSEFKAVSVVGLGEKTKKNDCIELIDEEKESIRIAASAGCKTLDSAGLKGISIESLGDAEAAAEGSLLSTFVYQQFRTVKKPDLAQVKLAVEIEEENECIHNQWRRGEIKANAQNLARRLADTPSNHMTPLKFANEAKNLLNHSKGFKVNIREKAWIEGEKMGAFLSVARGSCEPPVFLDISYQGNEKDNTQKPIVIVGKGITFDAGGISIKPSLRMEEMRADMGGAAVTLATAHALGELKTPINAHFLIPLAENLPSGSATRPGDVVTSRSGKTIAVDNTDAEGRLVLADALDYSATYDPRLVLDIATLTGAVEVALGRAAAGVFSNNDVLWEALKAAGCSTGDRVWRLPLWKHYTKRMTDFRAYDLNNVGKGRGGGSCTAAAFLREFVPKNLSGGWMHLDIAGIMHGPDDAPYLAGGGGGGVSMTGRPTRTVIEFVESQVDKC